MARPRHLVPVAVVVVWVERVGDHVLLLAGAMWAESDRPHGWAAVEPAGPVLSGHCFPASVDDGAHQVGAWDAPCGAAAVSLPVVGGLSGSARPEMWGWLVFVPEMTLLAVSFAARPVAPVVHTRRLFVHWLPVHPADRLDRSGYSREKRSGVEQRLPLRHAPGAGQAVRGHLRIKEGAPLQVVLVEIAPE